MRKNRFTETSAARTAGRGEGGLLASSLVGSPTRRSIKYVLVVVLAILLLATEADAVVRRRCAHDQSPEAATWLSIAHPGLGEWYLKGWGPFFDNAPQKKFWLGFIPIYGWPGYLQVKSAIDSHNCRSNDDL
jgi:hypothetical protein